ERLRLEEMREGALEDRIDADLALGRHSDLIAELQTLVREHPLRERLSGQLMLALYRSGRQAEALDTYQQTRRRLVEELRLGPGEGLKRLQRRVLEQDPALGGPEPPERTSTSSRASRLRRPWLLVAGLVVAGVAVATVFGATSGSSGIAVRADSIA